jgi:uncharacterized membrane protein
MARADELGRSAARLPRLRLGLGALAPSDAAALAVTATMAAVTAAVFLRIAEVRWASFETSAFDLGFFDQITWNTAHGAFFQSTFIPYNFTGQHFEPVLLAFVPAYWLGAGPPFLLATQAAVAAAAAIPLHLAARRLGLAPLAAWAASAGYLANAYLHRAITFDFHPEVMIALPAFSAAWAIASGRRRLAVGLALSVLCFKEDAVFVAMALAGFMWLRGMRHAAVVTAATSIAFAVIVVLVAMPLVRHGVSSDLVQRYGYLGHGEDGFALLAAIAAHPWRPLAELLSPDRLRTAALFIVFTAPLALTRPWLLAGTLPGLALALLSASPQQHALELHYGVEIIPVAVLAAVIAAAALAPRLPSLLLAALLVVPSTTGAVLLHPLAGAHGNAPAATHRAALEAAIALVPPGASVSAQTAILPRLTHRGQAHEFPSYSERADYVIVDRYGARSSQSIADGFGWRLSFVRDEARLVFDRDGVQVFER